MLDFFDTKLFGVFKQTLKSNMIREKIFKLSETNYDIDIILPLISAPMDFEILRSGAYWRAVHKRGRCFFQSKNIYFGPHSCEHRRILTKELFRYFNFKSNFNLQLCWSHDLLCSHYGDHRKDRTANLLHTKFLPHSLDNKVLIRS